MSTVQTQQLVMNTTSSEANTTGMLSWTEEARNTTTEMTTTQQPGYVSVSNFTHVPATDFTDTGQTDLEKVADNWGYFWLLLLPLCSVGGNMAVILVVHRSPRLHTLLYYLLASLAGAHMMTALLVAPLALATELLESFPLSQELCRAWLAVDVILILTGLTHLGLAVYSCRVALLRPLRYKLRAAVRYIACQIGLAWGLALVLATPFIVVITVMDVDDGKSFRGCEPWQVEHTLARVLPAFYIPLVVLCGLYVWTLQTAKSRTALALQLAEATGTANSSTSNGDVTGLDRLDTEFYTMQENGEPNGDSFLVWHQARLEAKGVEESNKMNDIAPVSSPRLNAHSIVTTKPSTSSGELSPIYPNNGQLDSHHLGVDPFLKINTEEMEIYPVAIETDSPSPKNEEPNPTERGEEHRRDSLQCPPIVRKDTLDCIISPGVIDSQSEEVPTATSPKKSDEKQDADGSSPKHSTPSSEQKKPHKAQRPTDLIMPEVTQGVDCSGSKAEDILSPRTVGACESILKALEGNDDELSPTPPTEAKGELVSTCDKQPTIDAAAEVDAATVKDADGAEKACLHQTSSSDSTTSVRSQGRASKEQLNEPLEEKDILLELEQDTQHLLADNTVPESLAGVVNPAFDYKDISHLETDSIQEGGSENGDMPLCNAIRVKHDVQEKKEGEGGGDEKTGEEDPGAKNPEGSRRSSVSGESGFSGPRRSILRRDGSKRGASTKSVKFSNKVETKVLTKEKSLSIKKTPNSRKGKSIAHKPSSKTAKKQKIKKETSVTLDNQDQENTPQSTQKETKDIEKDPKQYQVIHRGRVANGSLRNPHRMRLTNGKLAISGTAGVDGEVVVDYLAEVQRRQGVRICRRVREQQDALQMLAIVFATYLILLLPHHVLHTVLGICDSCRDDVSDALVTAFRWLALSTCAINPLLYCLVSVTFRRSLDKACCRCCCKCCCCCCPSP